MKSNEEILESTLDSEQSIESILVAMKQAQIEILEKLEDRFNVGGVWEDYFTALNDLKYELL